MTTMYQSVDDPEDIELEIAAERARARRKLWVWLALAIAVLALVATFSGNRKNKQPDMVVATHAEQASYRTAISEPGVDLRRARLRDFETTYPQSEFLPAVRAQLSVLDTHETKAWAALTDTMYDPEADQVTKLAAIQAYEQAWGASYLGGRGDEIDALRREVEVEPVPAPNRELTDVKSPIPKNVPDKFMVGGPQTAPPPPRAAPIRPYVPPPPRQAVAQTIEPEIRKNVTPRYPRRAQKRGISAVVELALSIDDEGDVQMTKVLSVRAEKYEKDFIKASERAAKRTRYSPKMVNGKAVPTSGITKRYVFQMD